MTIKLNPEADDKIIWMSKIRKILEGAAELENLKGSQFNDFSFSHEFIVTFSSNFPHNKVLSATNEKKGSFNMSCAIKDVKKEKMTDGYKKKIIWVLVDESKVK